MGILLKRLTILSEKPFLTFNVNLTWHNLRPFPLFLSLVAQKKSAPHHNLS